MPTRLGPFQFVYSSREQKIRDTVKHMVAKHGLVRAHIIIGEEYRRASSEFPWSESAIYWNDVRWAIKQLVHSLNWGREVGL